MSYQHNDRRDSRRPNHTQKKEWNEKTVLSFRGQTAEVFFHPADAVTQAVFFSNLKNLQTGNFKFDEGSFKSVASQAPTTSFNGGSEIPVLGVENLRSALRAGEELFTGFEPDGATRNCGVCGIGFQPVRIPFKHKDGTPGCGGNFATLAATKLAELIGKGGDLATRVSSASDAMTREVMGDEPVPSRARLLSVCKQCREVLDVPTFALETAKAGLLGAAQRIGVVADRFAAAKILGRGQQNRQHISGASDHRGRRDNDRPTPPEFEKVNWHGAQLQRRTADAFTAAGYLNLTDAIAAAENGELEKKGIASERSLGPITDALKRAVAGTSAPNFVGSGRATGAPGAVPGNAADRPTKQVGGKKRKQFTAPRRSNGEGAGLANLRD